MSSRTFSLNYNASMDPWLAAMLENPDLAGSAIRELMPIVSELEPVDVELQAVAAPVFEQQAGLVLAAISSGALSARTLPLAAVPATPLTSIAGHRSVAPPRSLHVRQLMEGPPFEERADSSMAALGLGELEGSLGKLLENNPLVASSKPALVAKEWIRDLGHATLFEIKGLSQQLIASSYPRSKDAYWGCISARGTVAGIQLEIHTESAYSPCHNYHPLPGERYTVNGFEITLVGQEPLPCGVNKRLYQITDMAGLSSRIFTHLQLKWPDFGVPSAASFMELLMAQQEALRGGVFRETLIHCRGGVGRTGTVVYAIVLSELRGDPEAVLKQLRKKRYLVETSTQEKLAIGAAKVLTGELTLEQFKALAAMESPRDMYSLPAIYPDYNPVQWATPAPVQAPPFKKVEASTRSADDLRSTLLDRHTVVKPSSLLPAASSQPSSATSLFLSSHPAPSTSLVTKASIDPSLAEIAAFEDVAATTGFRSHRVVAQVGAPSSGDALLVKALLEAPVAELFASSVTVSHTSADKEIVLASEVAVVGSSSKTGVKKE